MTRFTVVIPARHASSRLPGKMLADIAGKPMVVRVAERAALSQASQVVIATDHEEILNAVHSHNFRAVMTNPGHPTGTDRISQAIELLKLGDEDIVVNVQGDEPQIDPAIINSVADLLSRDQAAAIATCAARLNHAEQLFNPNVVKVVCDQNHHALYFSRAPIPWDRNTLSKGGQHMTEDLPALHHIGLYAYRVNFLKLFPTLNPGVLEQIESLEQLRALENGFKIAVQTVSKSPFAGVDTQTDLDRVREYFASSA
jgi:3-deoxy-manno-octulosonate cytidylyltransferase (CMP-KDO synthetase)